MGTENATAPEPYTPTDEDMRKRHRYAWEQNPASRHALDEADAQWTRWLAAHDARVKAEAWDEGREVGREGYGAAARRVERNHAALQ